MNKYPILSKLKSPTEVQKYSLNKLESVAAEIRQKIIELAKNNQIHYSSNLGIVELTVAMAKCFNFEKDKIIFDIGHQSYPYKMLTNRFNDVDKIRQYKHICGFQNIFESKYDYWSAGHAGTSLAALIGYSINNKNFLCSVIGNGSLENGESFEALNNIYKNKNTIIILNDNEMSISQPTTSINLITLKNKNKSKAFFNSLGFNYLYLAEGNNISKIVSLLNKAKKMCKNRPIVLHIKTKKGFGDVNASKDKTGFYHVINLNFPYKTFGEIAAKYLIKLTKKNKNIHILNPAMNIGSSFLKYQLAFPNNYHDFGISEECVVSTAAAMSLNKLTPVCVFYSTFIQRSVDQIIHDVGRMNLPVLFLIDKIGLSNDGDSHNGIYDISLIKAIPNSTITVPRNYQQLQQLIDLGIKNKKGPFFIRYPKIPYITQINTKQTKIEFGQWEYMIHKPKNKVCIVSYGPYIELIYSKIKNLNIDLINSVFVTKYDINNFKKLSKYNKIIFYEREHEGNLLFNDFCKSKFNKNQAISICYKGYIKHGNEKQLDIDLMMDIDSILKTI